MLRECGKIEGLALLMGGESPEAGISREGAEMVAQALGKLGVDHQLIDVKDRRRLLRGLASGEIRSAFNLVHGSFGEDGSLTALIEHYGVPHTGAAAASAMLCYDKDLCKSLWRNEGLATPNWERLAPDAGALGLSFPLMCKPTHSGSSLGMEIIEDAAGLAGFAERQQGYGALMAEELVDGREYSASFVQGVILPVIELKVEGRFYDYHAKYISEATEYLPAPHIDSDVEISDTLMRAWRAVNCEAWGRIDFIVSERGGAQLLEINSVPGMGGHSLLPKSAALAGYSYEGIVGAILANIKEEEG